MSNSIFHANIEEAREMVCTILSAGLVPNLQSSPGMGKSALIKSIANEYKLNLIDLRLSQCDPTDLSGLPNLDGDKATWKTFDCFPLETDPVPEGTNGWLLFLDEMNSASKNVAKAAYKLVLDRMVGQKKLHPKVRIVCAGNLSTDNALTSFIGTALVSRMCHIYIKNDYDAWKKIANEIGIVSEVKAYLESNNGEHLSTFDPESEDIEAPYCCPRTWEYASKLVKVITRSGAEVGSNPIHVKLFASILSSNVAINFVNFCKLKNNLPTIKDIIDDPENTKIPLDMSSKIFLTYMMLDYVDSSSIPSFTKYIQRLDESQQLLFVKSISDNKLKILECLGYKEFSVFASKLGLNIRDIRKAFEG